MVRLDRSDRRETTHSVVFRRVSEATGGPIPPLPLSLPDPYIRNPYPQKAGNALVTPLVLRVSMGGADCLPSDPYGAYRPPFGEATTKPRPSGSEDELTYTLL
ncbi:unnamed protein product [Spodoptera exigua]|nr:unnamed protein product [Spodoptera exigua]